MAVLAKHYIAEWERHPDLYVFDITAAYPALAALRVAVMASERFGFPRPVIKHNKRRVQGLCLGFPDLPKMPCTITLGANFTVGQVLHELAHAWCFYRYGDHDHGSLFVGAMDDLAYWFRLEEAAQHAFFP